MASKIVLKKSSVAAKVPVAGDLDFGELAINYTDGKLYFKKADNTIDAFTTAAASAPVTSVGGNIGDITDAQLLASIKNVDGTGSGLDADTLDGNHASAFYLASNPNGYTSNTGTVTSVGATAPLVSSGGTDPSISIPAANSTTDGYMSSAYASKLDGIAAGANNYTLPTATSTVLGGIELFSDTVQTVAANAVTATTSRTYGVQLNSSGQAVVNIPWVNTTYSVATSTTAGLIELGSDTVQTVAANAVTATASRTYALQLNSSGQAVVNVPWANSGGTVTSVSGTGTVSGLTLTGTVTGSGSLTLGGTLSLTSAQVTTALGYTPYNAGTNTVLTNNNYSGYSSFSGVVTSGSGFQTATYISNARNRIWSFGNSDTYGLSYFQGTAGYAGTTVDTIGLHFGTATAAASQFRFNQDGSFNTTGAITQAGNQVLHASNYTNYRHDRIAEASGNYVLLSSGNELEFYNSSGSLIPLYLQYSGASDSLRGPGGNVILHGGNVSSYALVQNTWQNSKYFGTDGAIYGTIFYDSNNSGYYSDPNGTSRLGTVNADTLRSYNNIYLDNNYGSSIIGVYSSYRYQGVFSMGDAYKLALDGTTTGNLYGIAWSHPNAGGIAGNLNTHGALILENGGFLAAISGSIRSRDDMRSPIFYDSNNTGYYTDPASVSYMYGLTLAGGSYFRPQNWIQLDSSYGLYWPNHYSAHLHANDLSSYTQIALRGGKNSYGGIYDQYSAVNGFMYDSGGNGGVYREANGRWYFYYNLSNDCMGIGTSSTSSTYSLYLNKGVYAQSRIDATIFYDTNNTGYYVDPNSTTYIYYLQSATTVRADSDRRLKDNIKPIENALEKVRQLQGCTYTRKDMVDKTKVYMGMIAQDVLPVVPEVVGGSEEGKYSLGYAEMVPLLNEAIKEQDMIILQQEARIAKLEALVNKLIG